jgi:hypothetical protein
MLLRLLTPPWSRDLVLRLDDSGPWIRVRFRDGEAELIDPRLIARLVNGNYACRVEDALPEVHVGAMGGEFNPLRTPAGWGPG